MLLENITTFTKLFNDPRRGQGQRHRLHDIIVIMLMAILTGHQSIKGFARFAKSNRAELIAHLGLKHGVPSFNTFRYILESIGEDIFAQNFLIYMKQQYGVLADEYISIDGKSVRSSVKGGNTDNQHFVSLVSAFGQNSKMVYGMQAFENKKSAESEIVRDLASKLALKDKTFTLDALHCQKKRSP
ncbi:MAG TPA: ISAs1 family transposase [Chitinophagales bacterium]|nr:ISAs1 family transposase [Chitinophagales bacterium]HRK25648.1 ISAs1 family transposase [Chitinophagales bacterium]